MLNDMGYDFQDRDRIEKAKHIMAVMCICFNEAIRIVYDFEDAKTERE